MSNINFTCPHCSRLMQLPAALGGKQGKCPSCSSVITVSSNAPANLPISPQQHPVQQPPSQQPPTPQPPPTVNKRSVGLKERQQLRREQRREQKGRIVRRRAIIGISACFGIVILIVLGNLPDWYDRRQFKEIHQQAFDKYERAMQTYNQRCLLAVNDLKIFLVLADGNPSISPEKIGDARQKMFDAQKIAYKHLEQAFDVYANTYVTFGQSPPSDAKFPYPSPPANITTHVEQELEPDAQGTPAGDNEEPNMGQSPDSLPDEGEPAPDQNRNYLDWHERNFKRGSFVQRLFGG
jgi:hypothetical protein